MLGLSLVWVLVVIRDFVIVLVELCGDLFEREVGLLKEQLHRPLQNQARESRLGSLYYDNKN